MLQAQGVHRIHGSGEQEDSGPSNLGEKSSQVEVSVPGTAYLDSCFLVQELGVQLPPALWLSWHFQGSVLTQLWAGTCPSLL